MGSIVGRLGVAWLGLVLGAGALVTGAPAASASFEPAVLSMDEAITRLSVADTQGGGEEPAPDDSGSDDSGSEDSGSGDSGAAEGSQ